MTNAQKIENEKLYMAYVRQCFEAATQRGIPGVDLAYAMLIQSAAVIRCREGGERFIEIMERCANHLDDEAAADERGAVH